MGIMIQNIIYYNEEGAEGPQKGPSPPQELEGGARSAQTTSITHISKRWVEHTYTDNTFTWIIAFSPFYRRTLTLLPITAWTWVITGSSSVLPSFTIDLGTFSVWRPVTPSSIHF